MAEIYCKRCLHHEELGRPLRVDEACPNCGAGVHRRKGKAPRPSSHIGAVLRAIFSLRGVFFLIGFSLIGMVPIGALAWASIIMLFLGSLKLAIKSMNTAGGKVEFPEVSPEELLDKSALIPALAFVFAFVWAPPILLAYTASGAFTLSPTKADFQETHDLGPPAASALTTSTSTSSKGAKRRAAIPEMADLPGGIPGMNADGTIDPQMMKALEQAGISPDVIAQAQKEGGGVDPKALTKALEDTPAPAPHLRVKAELDASRIFTALFGLFLFFWAPMALILYLRTSSTVAMFHVVAGARTIWNDVGGYVVLCMLVLPALAMRFLIDLYSSTSIISSPPLLFLKGVVVLLSWALCGLYVRQHARAFDMPVDDDDWTPNVVVPRPHVDPPLVTGQLL